jgi:thiosulfate/3-mercaptopyruvate sulfurtransferase
MKKIFLLIILLISLTIFGKDYSQYKSDVLISPKTAKKLITEEKNLVIIDVRRKLKFFRNHVKGSYNMWRPDMESKDGRYGKIKGMRASREELEEEFSEMGINNDTLIILLGDNLDEYRLWWIMDLYGATNMKIVDGGYAALKKTGIKTELGREAKVKKGTYKFPESSNKDTVSTFDDVKACLNTHVLILDTRSNTENNGTDLKVGASVKGKIPGCTFLEWSDALDENKQMKSYDELVKLFNEKGVVKSKEIIAYCQSAVRSAHTTFVLKELLGYKNVKNYDGSWIEWSYQASKNNAPIK